MNIEKMSLKDCVGYLAGLYADCDCDCTGNCFAESWYKFADKDDALHFAEEHKQKCMEQKTYDACQTRIIIQRVLDAVDKQIPKNPKVTDIDYRCPCCGMLLAPMCNYCEVCGQKIGTGWDEE